MERELQTIHQLTCLQLSGNISQEEQAQLDELISRNRDAMAHYEELCKHYDSAEVRAVTFDGSRIQLGIWSKLEQQRAQRKIRYYSVAAILTLAVASMVYLFAPRNAKKEPSQALAAAGISLQLPNGNTIDLSNTSGKMPLGATTLNNANKILSYSTAAGSAAGGLATLRVPVGKDYKLELADGSEVWLNSATTVKFPFSFGGNTREITIDGEAYVKVAPDATKPFTVHLPGSSVQVLGTEFNINTYDSLQSSVALVAGTVKYLTPGQSQVIKPGFAATYKKGSGISMSTFDEDLTLSWRRGVFVFENASLQEISRVLPRWFGVQVVLDDPALGEKYFSGTLDRNRPLDKQLAKFVAASNMNFYFEGDVLHFK